MTAHRFTATRLVDWDTPVPLTPAALAWLRSLPAAHQICEFRKLLEHADWLARELATFTSGGHMDISITAHGSPDQVMEQVSAETNPHISANYPSAGELRDRIEVTGTNQLTDAELLATMASMAEDYVAELLSTVLGPDCSVSVHLSTSIEQNGGITHRLTLAAVPRALAPAPAEPPLIASAEKLRGDVEKPGESVESDAGLETHRQPGDGVRP